MRSSAGECWPLDLDKRTLRALNRELYRYVARQTGSPQAAEDITQDVWLACQRYRGESSVRSFVFAVARRRVAEWFRQGKRERARLVALPELVDQGEMMPSLYAQSEDAARLRTWVAELPEPFRGTMRLWLTGMPPKAIAAELGCSQNTVRSRMFRGRSMLLAKQSAVYASQEDRK